MRPSAWAPASAAWWRPAAARERDHHHGGGHHHHAAARPPLRRRRGDGPRGQDRLGHHDHRYVRGPERAGRLPSANRPKTPSATVWSAPTARSTRSRGSSKTASPTPTGRPRWRANSSPATSRTSIFAGMTPVVNIPVGQQCEANGVPCVTYGCPMEPWFFGMGGDPAVGFKWAYNVFWSIVGPERRSTSACSTRSRPTRKWPASGPTTPTASPPPTRRPASRPRLQPAGYTWVNPGLVTGGTEDFSSVINQFKAEGCECLTALLNPPDFANFWKQAKQQGCVPKVTAIGRAILTRPDMDAVGDIGNGLSNEVWWENTHPFTSSLTGLTCQEHRRRLGTAESGHSVQPGSGSDRRRRLRRDHRRGQADGQPGRPGILRGGHQGHRSADPGRPGQVRRALCPTAPSPRSWAASGSARPASGNAKWWTTPTIRTIPQTGEIVDLTTL